MFTLLVTVLFVCAYSNAKPLEDHLVGRQSLKLFMERPSDNHEKGVSKSISETTNKQSQYMNSVNDLIHAIQLNTTDGSDDLDDPIVVTLVLYVRNRTTRANDNKVELTDSKMKMKKKSLPDYEKLSDLLNSYSDTFRTPRGEGYMNPMLDMFSSLLGSNKDALKQKFYRDNKLDFNAIEKFIDDYATANPQKAELLRTTTLNIAKDFFAKQQIASPIVLNDNPSIKQMTQRVRDFIQNNPKDLNMLKQKAGPYFQDLIQRNTSYLLSVYKQFSSTRRSIQGESRSIDAYTNLDNQEKVDPRDLNLYKELKARYLTYVKENGQLPVSQGGFAGQIDGFQKGFNEINLGDYGNVVAVGLNGELITDKALISRLLGRKSVLNNNAEEVLLN